MKVTQEKEFTPIMVTFETEKEVRALWDLIGNTSGDQRMKMARITKEQDKVLVELFGRINNILYHE